MPLDLGQWGCLWDEDADDGPCNTLLHATPLIPSLVLNPDPDGVPSLDPKDRFLLGDPSANSTPYSNGIAPVAGSGASTPLPAHVPWLRKTEYLSREGVQRNSSIQEMYDSHLHACLVRLLTDPVIENHTCSILMFLAPPNYETLRHRLLHATIPLNSIFRPSVIRTSRALQLSNHSRYTQTLTFGPTRMICSGLASGLVRNPLTSVVVALFPTLCF